MPCSDTLKISPLAREPILSCQGGLFDSQRSLELFHTQAWLEHGPLRIQNITDLRKKSFNIRHGARDTVRDNAT